MVQVCHDVNPPLFFVPSSRPNVAVVTLQGKAQRKALYYVCIHRAHVRCGGSRGAFFGSFRHPVTTTNTVLRYTKHFILLATLSVRGAIWRIRSGNFFLKAICRGKSERGTGKEELLREKQHYYSCKKKQCCLSLENVVIGARRRRSPISSSPRYRR